MLGCVLCPSPKVISLARIHLKGFCNKCNCWRNQLVCRIIILTGLFWYSVGYLSGFDYIVYYVLEDGSKWNLSECVLSLCAYRVCLGDVSQCPRRWGGVAICRGTLGVANHSCCLTLCCLQLSLSDGAEKVSLLCQGSAHCYKGKLMFFYLFSSLHSLQVSSDSPQGQLYYWMYPFSLICFGIKGLCEGKYQLLILGFRNTQSDTLFLFDWSKLQSHFCQQCWATLLKCLKFWVSADKYILERAVFGSEIVSKMPGKEHYNLEHSPLECSRFLIRQKLGGWMFFRGVGLEKGIVLRMLGVLCLGSSGFCFKCFEI